MKIRTDFVTNSSSSSFCVSFSGENIGLEIKGEEYDGDYQLFGLSANDIYISFGEEDFDDDSAFYIDDLQYSFGFEPFFLGYLLDLEDTEEIKEFILEMITVTDESILEEFNEPEEDDEDEEGNFNALKFIEDIVKNGKEIMSSVRKSLESIKSKEDVLSWSMTMKGGGRGEGTQGFGDLLDRIFGYEEFEAIADILNNQEYGSDEKLSELRALPFLEHVSDQGLMNIIEFEDECEGVSVKQYFDEDGKVVFEIENTDGMF